MLLALINFILRTILHWNTYRIVRFVSRSINLKYLTASITYENMTRVEIYSFPKDAVSEKLYTFSFRGKL